MAAHRLVGNESPPSRHAGLAWACRPYLAGLLGPRGRVLAIPARGAGPPPVFRTVGDDEYAVHCEILPADGDVEARVAATAEREAAQVIALPLYGNSPAVRTLANSRALRLLSTAGCSLLLVPDSGWAPELLA